METKIKEFMKFNIGVNTTVVQKDTPWAYGDRYKAQSLFKKYLVYTRDGEIDCVYRVKGNDRKVVYKKSY